MKKNQGNPTSKKPKASASSMRLALENRLLFDGTIVAAADAADPADDKNHDQAAGQGADTTRSLVDAVFHGTAPPVAFGDDFGHFADNPTIVLASASAGAPHAPNLYIADTRAPRLCQLLANLPADSQIHVLDNTRDGYSQIKDILGEHSDPASLHLLTGQDNGQNWLGSSRLASGIRAADQNNIADWGDSLSPGSHITVHGSVDGVWQTQIQALTGNQVERSQPGLDNWLATDQSVSTATQVGHGTELVFIDSGVIDYQVMLDGIRSSNPDAIIFKLDARQDGVKQIDDITGQFNQISALHIVSHGGSGELRLGDAVLNFEGIQGKYRGALTEIGLHLSQNADILVYGCDFGSGILGQIATARLAQATGADVADSSDATGAASLGGDWTLENSFGQVVSAGVNAASWDGLLNVTVNYPKGQVLVASGNTIYTVDPTTGKSVALKTVPTSVSTFPIAVTGVNGLAIDQANGLIYFSDGNAGQRYYAWDYIADNFITIDANAALAGQQDSLATAPGMPVGFSLGSNALGAVWGGGKLYVGTATSNGDIYEFTMSADGRSVVSGKLFANDPPTGAATYGDLGFMNVGGTDYLFAVGSGGTKLLQYKLDGTLVTTKTPADMPSQLATGADGTTLYYFNNNKTIRSYDFASNTSGGTSTINMTNLQGGATVSIIDGLGYTPAQGSIGDTVFTDTNTDGVFNAGDTGIANVTVQLIKDDNNNGVVDAGDTTVATDTTDAAGKYLFSGVLPFAYIVHVNDANTVLGATLPTTTAGGRTQTEFMGALVKNTLIHDFGFEADTDKDGIANSIDLDDDNDGILDVNEGDETVTVKLTALTADSGTGTNFATFTGTAADGSTVTITMKAPDTAGLPASASNALQNEPNDTLIVGSVATGAVVSLRDLITAVPGVGGPGESAVVITSSVPLANIRFLDLDDFDNSSLVNAVVDALATNVPGSWKVNSNSPGLISAPFVAGGWGTEFATKGAQSQMLYLATPGGAGFNVNNADVTFIPTTPTNQIVLMYEDISLLANGTLREAAQSDFTILNFQVQLVKRDTDSDGIPDSLDLDSDNDGISDYYESTTGANAALAGKDTNKDGTISLAEGGGDLDKDGLMDMFDKVTTGATATTSAASIGTIATNTDGDTRADYLDLDSDNEGIADTVEARLTAGYVANDDDVRDNDADKDGVINIFDNNDSTGLFGGTFVDPINTDTAINNSPDATPDYLDLDSDGDGTSDATESGLSTNTADANGDGIRDSVLASYTDPDGLIANNTGATPSTELGNELGDTSEVGYREHNLPPLIDLNGPATTTDANRNNAVTYTENAAPVNISGANGDINDGGNVDITKLAIAVGGFINGASEIVNIGGTDFPLNAGKTATVIIGGTTYQVAYTTGGFVITNNAGATIPMAQADMDALVQGITYVNNGETPTAGIRSFNFTAIDAAGLVSPPVAATIAVVPVNDRPVAVNDGLITVVPGVAKTIAILGNDTDPENNPLSVASVTDPAAPGSPLALVVGTPVTLLSGSVVSLNANGTLDVVMAMDNSETESFSYTISDGNGGTASAIVTLARDTDADGIANSFDLDDDNDGITDLNEIKGNGGVASLPTFAAMYTDGTTLLPNSVTATLAVTGVGSSQPVGSVVGNSLKLVDINSNFSDPDNTFNNYAVIRLQFSEAIRVDGIFDLIDVDNHQRASVFGVLNGQLVPLNQVAFNGGSLSTGTFGTLPSGLANNASFDIISNPLATNNTVDGRANVSNLLDALYFVWNTIEINDFKSSASVSFASTISVAKVNSDTDGDGIINSLDLDSDNDGISDLYESTGGKGVALADINNDGTVGLAEAIAAGPPPGDGDIDNDGLMDIFDDNNADTSEAASLGTVPVNTDADARVDYLDLDSDNDGIADTVEARLTAGYAVNDGDVRNNDVDQDGIIDMFDNNDSSSIKLFGGSFIAPINTDVGINNNPDSVPDYLDADSDGDGKLDSAESGLSATLTDANNDGIRDSVNASYADPDGLVADNAGGAPSNTLANQSGDTTEVDYREISTRPLIDLNSPATETDTARDNTLTYTENGASVPVATALADVNDNAENDITALILTVSGNTDGASEVIGIGGVSFPLNADSSQTIALGGTTFNVAYTTAGGFSVTNATGAADPMPQAGLDSLVRSITYQNASENPTDTNRTLSFTVVDAGGLISPPAVATISVNPVNDPPVAVDDGTVATPKPVVEDTATTLDLKGNDTDVDGDTLTVQSINGTSITPGTPQTIAVANGTVSVDAAGVITFTPALNYNGPVTFDYVIRDTSGLTDTGAVNLDVTPANDPPVAIPKSVNAPEDTEVPVTLGGTDVEDGSATSISMISLPPASQGILYLADGTTLVAPGLDYPAGSFIFKPAPNFNGSVDPIPFTVKDSAGQASLLPASLDITLDAVNDPPVATPDVASTPINIPVNNINILGNDSDIDGNPLTVAEATLADPTQGSVSINPDGSLNFTPGANITGSVTINYTIDDGNGGTAASTVTIDVGANTPPDSLDKTFILPQGSPQTFSLADIAFIDPDAAQTLQAVRIDTLPTGSLTLDGNPVVAGQAITVAQLANLKFTPAANANNEDSFTFSVQDSAGDFDTTPNTITFALNITPANELPMATPYTRTGNEDTPIPVSLSGVDIDGAISQVTVTGLPPASQGILYHADGTTPIAAGVPMAPADAATLVFKPAPNFNGAVDSINFTVTDNDGGESPMAGISLNVTPVENGLVVVNDGEFTIGRGQPLTGNVLDNDRAPGGARLTVSQFSIPGVGTFLAGATATLPGIGTLTLGSGGGFTFVPDPDYQGPVPRVIYTATDGIHSGTGTLALNVDNSELNIGALVMLSNPTPELLPGADKLAYSLSQFRQPDNAWDSNEPYQPARLRLSGNLQDYDLFLTANLRNQAVVEMNACEFNLPFSAFRHSNPNEQLEYIATRVDGSALPRWLNFDPKMLKFSGTPPKGAPNVEVLVKAADRYGKEAFATFKVIVNRDSNGNQKAARAHKAGHQQVQPRHHGHSGKPGMNQQVLNAGKIGRLIESRALLESLKQL